MRYSIELVVVSLLGEMQGMIDCKDSCKLSCKEFVRRNEGIRLSWEL